MSDKTLFSTVAICVQELIVTALLLTDIIENKLIKRKDYLKSKSELVANLTDANHAFTTISNTAYFIDFCFVVTPSNEMVESILFI